MQVNIRHIILIILLVLFSFNAQAQNFQLISHLSGIAIVGNNVVEVTSSATPCSSATCPAIGAYWAGRIHPTINYTDDFTYKFFNPVQHARINIYDIDIGDAIRFFVNGQHYQLDTSNLTLLSAPSSCQSCTDSFIHIDAAGDLVRLPQNAQQPIGSNPGCMQVDIIAPFIDSIKIVSDTTTPSRGSTDGFDFGISFLEDTMAYITHPYNDTAYCQGQQIAIPYFTSLQFNNGNTFSIQMSDASGSFSSPTTIGTHADTVGDTIMCTIPLNTPAGTGYKFRITSTSPVRTPYINDFDSIEIKATVAGFSASSNTPVCAGDTLHLTGTSTSTGISWFWAGVGSFSSTAEDTFIVNPTTAMSGDYILTATLNSSGCSLKDTVSVLVKANPNKPTTSSNAPLCAGGTLNLTGSSTTSGITYAWTGPGSYTSSVQNPSINNINAGASGDYICSATANGCSSKDTIAVVINPIPNKPTAASNSPLCAGQDLNLTASTITAATYAWWGPAAFSSTTQNPTRNNITTSYAGTYYVSATVNGCTSDTDSVAVLVNPDPKVNIVATPGNDVCAGQSVSFVAFTANAGSNPSFQWMLNGAPTASTTTSYTNNNLQSGDVVYCIMNATGNCSSTFTDTSNITTMTVSPVVTPSVSISSNPTLPVGPWTMVTFKATFANGGNSPTFQWKRNGQDVVGATSDTWGTAQLNNNDVISVVLYSQHKCAVPDTAVSNAIDVLIDLGVDDITGGSLQLYPNPNSGSFTIKGEVANNKTIDLTIINELGQTVHQTTIRPQHNTINQQININKELATGVYLLQLRTEDGVSTVKLHIQ